MSEELPTVEARREAIDTRLTDAPGVLLCLDFDGTLAPIVDDPDEATMTDDCRSVLERLPTHPSAEVAVISGRGIDDLRERAAVDDAMYAGNHGLELYRSDQTEVVPEADEQRQAIDDICRAIEDQTTSIPGSTVEHKGVTATVHYRQVPEDDVGEVIEVVKDVVADADGEFQVLGGKEIREIRPHVDWDKGSVVELLAEDVPDDWEKIYVGDDTTDEDAFEVVEPDGLGVLVGNDTDTAASVCVRDQSAVADFLELVEDSQDAT